MQIKQVRDCLTHVSQFPFKYSDGSHIDLFLEEDLDYVRRLAGAGVWVELHVYPGAFHAFNIMPTAQITQTYNRDLAAAISTMLLA